VNEFLFARARSAGYNLSRRQVRPDSITFLKGYVASAVSHSISAIFKFMTVPFTVCVVHLFLVKSILSNYSRE
jgi:hypothetical protein